MKTKDISQIALMVALLIVMGIIPAIPLGFIPVPIVLQNMAVMLTAVLLGPKKGTLALILLLIIGLAIPVFSGQSTTLPVLMGPTAGYVIAWVFVPIVYNICHKALLKKESTLSIFVCLFLSGVLLVDVLGAIWLSHMTEMTLAAALYSNLVFIPGDTLKALLASFIGKRLLRHLN